MHAFIRECVSDLREIGNISVSDFLSSGFAFTDSKLQLATEMP